MPYPHNSVPKYRKHKPSGRAIVTVSGKDFYLGPHGTPRPRPNYCNWSKGAVDSDAISTASEWGLLLLSNRLRHSAATKIRKEFGLEAAQVCLGHSQASITELYAERDLSKAVEVARNVG